MLMYLCVVLASSASPHTPLADLLLHGVPLQNTDCTSILRSTRSCGATCGYYSAQLKVHHIIWNYLRIIFGALKRCVAIESRYNKDNNLNIFEDGAVE
jgi:hypothetical protein